MGVDIVQHLQISFDEYMQDAKVPIEEVAEALLALLRADAMASGDFQSCDLIEVLSPIYRNDPNECERLLRQMGENARDTYLETARRKLGWRTGFKFIGAVQSSGAEKLNLGSDTKHKLLQISVSEELLSRIPAAVSRATLLADWTVQEATSPAADRYLTEACNCFLFGFDTACVVMCRSLLEEVLESKLKIFLAAHIESKPRDGWTLGSVLGQINNYLQESGVDAGIPRLVRLVNEAGNAAAHQKTLTQVESVACLKNCRSALIKLL